MTWCHHRPNDCVDPSRRSEAGTGLISTTAGVTVFLVLLLFAVQLSVNLLATTTVTAAGYDAARTVASRRVDHGDPVAVAGARRQAESAFRRVVGRAASGARFAWRLDGQDVRLRVRMRAPAILPQTLGARVGLDQVDRTFVVRVEELR